MKSKYETHLEWKKACPLDHAQAEREGKLEEICELMGWPPPQRNGSKWNDDLEKLRVEYLSTIETVRAELEVDTHDCFVMGNKTAGLRVRKNTMKLRKLSQNFRRDLSKLRGEV